MFHRVRVKGVRVPAHTDFPEVNLRFYVRYQENNEWKRGVVFISEIVPKPAITWVANALFSERYRTLPLRHEWSTDESGLSVGYQWAYRDKRYLIEARAEAVPQPLPADSKEEFITEHFWGYSSMGADRTAEYEVSHPRWNIHPVRDYNILCQFGELYGRDFTVLDGKEPETVFLAEGSPIKVYAKKRIG
jgi:uncharacterized protein YqjF (DUF2071 family)